MIHDTLNELVQRYADGIATSAETDLLQEELRENPKSRALFREYLELDASLARFGVAAKAITAEHAFTKLSETKNLTQTKSSFREKPRRSFSPNNVTIALIAAILLLGVGTMWFAPGDSVSWATIIDAGSGVSIVHAGQSRPAHPGDRLETDDLINLTDESTARIRLAGFGFATLGPSTRLSCSDVATSIELERGFAEIAVDNPLNSRPWRIRTPQAEATGLSTEFSIASADGRTSLRVSEGQVHLTHLQSGKAEEVGMGTRAIVDRQSRPVLTATRPGRALVLASRKIAHVDWDEFNQLVAEKLLNARLWQMGFRVDVRYFEDVQVSDLADRAIVIVSLFEYGVGEPALERIGLANAEIPVICLEPAGFPTLGMTVEGESVGFGFPSGSSTVDFRHIHHPLAAGLHGLQSNLLHHVIGWGRPAGDAIVVAHLPDHPENATVFAYENRQMMAKSRAPERRVGLFLDPIGIQANSLVDWSLLEAAVNWCVTIVEPQ